MSPTRGTPARAVRFDPALWAAAKARAAERQETVSDVLRRALQTYVEDPPADHDDTVSPTASSAQG